jgi:hypothetical protein
LQSVPLLKAVHASAAEEGASLLLGLDANVHEVGDVPDCSRSLSWSLFSGSGSWAVVTSLLVARVFAVSVFCACVWLGRDEGRGALR